MILGMSIPTFTFVHTALSLVGMKGAHSLDTQVYKPEISAGTARGAVPA
jgi:hypothetical protein